MTHRIGRREGVTHRTERRESVCSGRSWVQKEYALLALLTTLGGCVPEFDDDLSIITAPRVLAVQADPAEAKPNEAVTISALVVQTDETAAPLVPRFSLCIDRKPLTELGPVNPTCLADPASGSAALLNLGAGNQVSATLPSEVCRLFGPTPPEAKEGEPAGRPIDPDQTGGYYQPIGVAVDSAKDVGIGAVRLYCPLPRVNQAESVAFVTRYRPNQNPEVRALELIRGTDSIALTAETEASLPAATLAPSERVTLRASWPDCPSEPVCGDGFCGEAEDLANCSADCSAPRGCAGAESYVWFDRRTRVVAPRRETIRISWFASAGKFDAERTGREEGETALFSDNGWRAPAIAGDVRIWTVIRDARGGQSWKTYRIAVAP
jgi:hypothetical protein